MNSKTIFDMLDPELAQRVLVNRREALLKVGKFGIAAATVPAAFGLMARQAFGQALPANIVEILNFALTLERLEASFYNQGVGADDLIPAETMDVFEEIRDNENAHVALLESVLGNNAADEPEFDFTGGSLNLDPFNNYQQFLALSQGFEDLGVRAYKGQAPALMGADMVLTTALQIHSVEARHAGVVRRIRGENAWITGTQNTLPAPFAPIYAGEDNVMQGGVDVTTVTDVSRARITEAFDEPLTMEQVLAIADPFIAD